MVSITGHRAAGPVAVLTDWQEEVFSRVQMSFPKMDEVITNYLRSFIPKFTDIIRITPLEKRNLQKLLKLASFPLEVNRLPRTDMIRITYEAAALRILYNLPESRDIIWNNVDQFMSVYGKFEEFSDIRPEEQETLLEYRNMMAIALRIMPAKLEHLVDIVAKTVEGYLIAYRNGSGRTKATSCRIKIFRHESGKEKVARANQPKRKCKSKESDNSASNEEEESNDESNDDSEDQAFDANDDVKDNKSALPKVEDNMTLPVHGSPNSQASGNLFAGLMGYNSSLYPWYQDYYYRGNPYLAANNFYYGGANPYSLYSSLYMSNPVNVATTAAKAVTLDATAKTNNGTIKFPPGFSTAAIPGPHELESSSTTPSTTANTSPLTMTPSSTSSGAPAVASALGSIPTGTNCSPISPIVPPSTTEIISPFLAPQVVNQMLQSPQSLLSSNTVQQTPGNQSIMESTTSTTVHSATDSSENSPSDSSLNDMLSPQKKLARLNATFPYLSAVTNSINYCYNMYQPFDYTQLRYDISNRMADPSNASAMENAKNQWILMNYANLFTQATDPSVSLEVRNRAKALLAQYNIQESDLRALDRFNFESDGLNETREYYRFPPVNSHKTSVPTSKLDVKPDFTKSFIAPAKRSRTKSGSNTSSSNNSINYFKNNNIAVNGNESSSSSTTAINVCSNNSNSSASTSDSSNHTHTLTMDQTVGSIVRNPTQSSLQHQQVNVSNAHNFNYQVSVTTNSSEITDDSALAKFKCKVPSTLPCKRMRADEISNNQVHGSSKGVKLTEDSEEAAKALLFLQNLA